LGDPWVEEAPWKAKPTDSCEGGIDWKAILSVRKAVELVQRAGHTHINNSSRFSN